MNDGATTGPIAGLGISGEDCLARARTLIPLLQAAAARIDAKYELPSDVLDAMHDTGMFRLLIPRAYDGFELKPSDYVRCIEAIAIGDASVAWCMNQGSGCSMTAAYMAPDISREIWGGKRDVLAWCQGPGAKAIRDDGGWRFTGAWSFATGSRHATWLGAMCPCFNEDWLAGALASRRQGNGNARCCCVASARRSRMSGRSLGCVAPAATIIRSRICSSMRRTR